MIHRCLQRVGGETSSPEQATFVEKDGYPMRIWVHTVGSLEGGAESFLRKAVRVSVRKVSAPGSVSLSHPARRKMLPLPSQAAGPRLL